MEDQQFTQEGRKRYSADLKRKVVNEIESGLSTGEASRKYDVPIAYLYRWIRLVKGAGRKALRSNEEVVCASEYRKIFEENKKLKQALGKMTLERDILQEAVDIASKKKWI